MDDYGGKSSGRNPEECRGETVESDDNNDTAEYTGSRSSDARLRFERGAGEGAGGWVGIENRANSVRYTDCNQFLVRINFITIKTTESWGNISDKFSQEYEGAYTSRWLCVQGGG